MKWSAWAGLIAPFVLLLLVLATVVALPRVQATHRFGNRAAQAPAPMSAAVTLPTVVVTPLPSQVAAQATMIGGSRRPSVTSTGESRPLGHTWLDRGMPYYSFASPVLISVKD